MDTIKLNVEVDANHLDLVKSFLRNINGILNVEEVVDTDLEDFLQMEKDFLSKKLEIVSEDDFKKNAENKVCELFSQK